MFLKFYKYIILVVVCVCFNIIDTYAATCYYDIRGNSVAFDDDNIAIKVVSTGYTSYEATALGNYSAYSVDMAKFPTLIFISGTCPEVSFKVITSFSINSITNTMDYTLEDSYSGSNESLNSSSGVTNCDGLLGKTTDPNDTAYYLQTALDIIAYVAIVALIGLSIVDYLRAVASSDADNLKTANSKVIKRLIYTVILFIFPSILEFFFELIGIYGSNCGLTL